MFAKERLYLTAKADRLVREGDKDAASLYVAAGDEIPASAAERFGLVDGTIADKGKGRSAQQDGTKEKKPGQDKEKKPDDGAGTKGDGSDDLTQVKFVGAKSATALAKAGLASFASLAAIDPASPPTVEGLGAQTNWAGIVESAKALVAASLGEGGAEKAPVDQEV